MESLFSVLRQGAKNEDERIRVTSKSSHVPMQQATRFEGNVRCCHPGMRKVRSSSGVEVKAMKGRYKLTNLTFGVDGVPVEDQITFGSL